MAHHPVETLKKLRAKMIEQRRAMAARLAGSSHTDNYDHWISLQAAIEATDRAIVEEEMGAEAEAPASEAA